MKAHTHRTVSRSAYNMIARLASSARPARPRLPTWLAWAALFTLLAGSLASAPAWGQTPAGATGTAPALGAGKQVLAPMSYQNLTLVPVISTAASTRPHAEQHYQVLDEGMRRGTVKVVETKDGGTVNELILVNRSSKPLFLLAGEVIIGGKQDRIIGKDMVIGPQSREKIPVFCVEHGRWSGRKAEFSTAKALAHTKLRKKAKYAGQSDVWREVASKNAQRSVENATDTYRHVAVDKTVAGSIAAYERHFASAMSSLAKRTDMVGYVVALNGEVVAIETFGSPTLFRQLEDKLLRSYYVEAIDTPFERSKAGVVPSEKAIGQFRAKARAAQRGKARTVISGKAARTVQFDDAEVEGSVVNAADAAASDEQNAPEPVYDSVFKKDHDEAATDESRITPQQNRIPLRQQRQQRQQRIIVEHE